jgi:hypothetical protein
MYLLAVTVLCPITSAKFATMVKTQVIMARVDWAVLIWRRIAVMAKWNLAKKIVTSEKIKTTVHIMAARQNVSSLAAATALSRLSLARNVITALQMARITNVIILV